mmetsp:Transcript_103293/g.308575  ORF Transcript_103293/g.308575 Transcript_103293/m.308575 type:complete len:211 (-) Transcript_103293:888-1520(-)
MVIISKPPMNVPNSNHPQATMNRRPEHMPTTEPYAVTYGQSPEKRGTTSVMVRISAMEKRSVSLTASPSAPLLSLAECTAKSIAGMLTMRTNASAARTFFSADHFCCCRKRDIVDVMAVWKESALEAIMVTTSMYMSTLMPLFVRSEPGACGISRTSKKTNAGMGLCGQVRPRSCAFSSIPVRPKRNVRKLTRAAPTMKPMRSSLSSFAA